MIKSIIINQSGTIKDAIEAINSATLQIALVVDDREVLKGTVTDGDVRRGLIRGLPLDAKVTEIMNSHPFSLDEGVSSEHALDFMRMHKIRHVPILNKKGRVVRLDTFDTLFQPEERDNWVILMAGGEGIRLKPLTEVCPKPMLEIGNRPILETIIRELKKQGFRKFFISVNYMAEVIANHFGDGSKWGVEIDYIYEDKKLGTAGSISLLPQKATKPILVMNGDLLTKVDFRNLFHFHEEHSADLTMGVREYEFQVPYGVVQLEEEKIISIDEKPVQKFFVNAGIYLMNPELVNLIPLNRHFDMPSLYTIAINHEKNAVAYPIREYWVDIGRFSDLERANLEFEVQFK
jgi:dTDP-glucose pyrophosphorylase